MLNLFVNPEVENTQERTFDSTYGFTTSNQYFSCSFKAKRFY